MRSIRWPLTMATGTGIVALVAITSVLVATPDLAYAKGPGRACVFIAPSEANGLGHVGWGYQVGGTDTYVYGATEGPTSWWPGAPNGAWKATGPWPQVLADFAGANPNVTNHYTQYRCKTVRDSAVGAANDQVNHVLQSGYFVFWWNCLDDMIRVLNAYGADLPPAADYPIPNRYFHQALEEWGASPWSGIEHLPGVDGG